MANAHYNFGVINM